MNDDDIYELDDTKNLMNVIKYLHDKNSYSSNLEGNCLYNHFTYDKNESNVDVRYNLMHIAKNAKKGVEIGFNAGHSTMLFFNSNPSLKMTCFDNCYHKYTIPCSQYLSSKYDLTLINGDSRETTFNITKTIDGPVDFVHVDGGHSNELAMKDIINCRQIADENTLLIVDDADYPNIQDIINFLISCNMLKYVNYEEKGFKKTEGHAILTFIK